MGKDNVRELFEELISNEKTRELLKDREKPETIGEVADTYEKIAKELGIDLTAEEIRTIVQEEEETRKVKTDDVAKAIFELQDSELDGVTGGDGYDERCRYSFKDKENCWFQDACDGAWHNYDNYICKRIFFDRKLHE